jgi:hypothetical protein
MEDRCVSFCACDADPPVLVANVPARVCTQCGEQMFTTPTLAVLERIRDGDAPPPRTVHFYAYDFAEAAEQGAERGETTDGDKSIRREHQGQLG